MKIIKTICATLFLVGMFVVVGSVGAIECDTVGIAQGLMQAVGGLALAAVSAFIGGLFE